MGAREGLSVGTSSEGASVGRSVLKKKDIIVRQYPGVGISVAGNFTHGLSVGLSDGANVGSSNRLTKPIKATPKTPN